MLRRFRRNMTQNAARRKASAAQIVHVDKFAYALTNCIFLLRSEVKEEHD